jgi:hypothetical protein
MKHRRGTAAVLSIRILLPAAALAWLAGCAPALPAEPSGEDGFGGPGQFAVRGQDTYPQPPAALGIEFVLGRSALPVPHYAYVNFIGLCPWTAGRARAEADSVALSAAELDALFAGRAEMPYPQLQLADILALHRRLGHGDLPVGAILGTATPTEPIAAYQNGRTALLPRCYGGIPGRNHFNVLNPTVREYIVRYALKLSANAAGLPAARLPTAGGQGGRQAGIFFDNVWLDLPDWAGPDGRDGWRWLSPISRADAEARYGDAVNAVLAELRARRPQAEAPLLNWGADPGVLDKLLDNPGAPGFGGLMLENFWYRTDGTYGLPWIGRVEFWADLAERLSAGGKKLLLKGKTDDPRQAEAMWALAHLIGQPGTYLHIQGDGRREMYPVWACYRSGRTLGLGRALDVRLRMEKGIARRRFQRGTVSYRLSAGGLSGVSVQRR